MFIEHPHTVTMCTVKQHPEGGWTPVLHMTGTAGPAPHGDAISFPDVLTAIMRRQLTEIHEAGREPVAALWASESSIYGRFGYGPAVEGCGYEIDATTPLSPRWPRSPWPSRCSSSPVGYWQS